jgi:hypothetical protein
VLVVGCPDDGRTSDESSWISTCGEVLQGWMGISPAETLGPETVSYISLPSPDSLEATGLTASTLLKEFPHARLILLLGASAHSLILRGRVKDSPEETIQAYDEFLPFFPLPDPRDLAPNWYHSHPWFEQTVLQLLRRCVALALEKDRI